MLFCAQTNVFVKNLPLSVTEEKLKVFRDYLCRVVSTCNIGTFSCHTGLDSRA